MYFIQNAKISYCRIYLCTQQQHVNESQNRKIQISQNQISTLKVWNKHWDGNFSLSSMQSIDAYKISIHSFWDRIIRFAIIIGCYVTWSMFFFFLIHHFILHFYSKTWCEVVVVVFFLIHNIQVWLYAWIEMRDSLLRGYQLRRVT